MKIILTGATGMVGEGVLHQCLLHPAIDAVLSVSRKPAEISHPKLKEIIVDDFFDLSKLSGLISGYDACFFCLGVSSVGMKEPEYFRLTHDLTMHFAETLSKENKAMAFCYISGTGTRSNEKGAMWARVKGKTENDISKLPFKETYNFRPGFMKPTKGLKRTLKAYKYFAWLYPVWLRLFPNYVCTLQEVGLAMINAAQFGYTKNIAEVQDIKILASR